MRVSVALSDILPTNTVVATFMVDVDIGTWTCGVGQVLMGVGCGCGKVVSYRGKLVSGLWSNEWSRHLEIGDMNWAFIRV